MQKFGLLFLAVSTALLGLVVPVEGVALVERETNAERFARGLPPLAPINRREVAKPAKRDPTPTVEERDHHVPRSSKRADTSIEERHVPRSSKRADMSIEERHVPRTSKRADMSVENRNFPRPSKRADTSVEKRTQPSKRADTAVEKRNFPRPSKRADTSVEKRNFPRPSKRADTSVEKRNFPRPSKRADTSVEKRTQPSKRADTSVGKRTQPSKRADASVENRNFPRPSKRADASVENRNFPRPSKRADVTVENRNFPRPSKRAEAEVFHAQNWEQLTSGRLEVRWNNNNSIAGYIANNPTGGLFGLNDASCHGEDDLYVEYFESNLMVMNAEFPPPYFVGGGDESSAVHDCSEKIRFGTVELGPSSAVWTLNPMTGELTAALINQRGSQDKPSLVYDSARNVLSFTHDRNTMRKHAVSIYLSD